MSKPYDIMAAGHLCLDIIPRFLDTGARQIAELLRPGKLVNVEEAAISTGGSVSNTGISAKTLGQRVCFCARVGDDAFGRITLDILRKNGNADGIHIVAGAASSYTLVVAPPGIDRIFLHNPGTNDALGPEDLDPKLIAQCRHFHFGYPPLMRRMFEDNGEALRGVFQVAKEAGATTSCDMTLPDPASPSGQVDWERLLARVLPYVDFFLPSVEETFFMLERPSFLRMKEEHHGAELIDLLAPEDFSRLATRALDMGCALVALKAGTRGFYLKSASAERMAGVMPPALAKANHWAGRELWAPALQAPRVASATGSGDSAIAGLLSGFLRELPIERALRGATCCGWQNVQVLDATSGIRSWEETQALLDQALPPIDPHIHTNAWRWREESQVWIGPGDSPA